MYVLWTQMVFRELTIPRVPRLTPAHRHDLYRHKGPPISFDPSVYYIQESHHHLDRIWRGVVVWWICDRPDAILVWPHGMQLGHRCMGRYSACAFKFWPCQHRGIREDICPQRRVHVDALQLLLQCSIRAGHAQEDKADQFQGFRQ